MTWARALIAWLLLFVVAFANGTFRQLYYEKFLGAQRANQVACGLGVVLIVAAVWGVSRGWRFRSVAEAWRAGGLWLALTVTFEFGFFHFVAGHPWDRLLHEYAIWQGRLWVLVLAGILLAPVLVHTLDGAWLKRKPAVGAAAFWALAGWAACGLTMGVGRAVWSLPVALWVHLAAAPVIFFIVTVFYWNHPRHLRAGPTAALFLAMVFGMDLLVVAPFFERSFAMFTSAIGTWFPFGLIFLGSLVAGMLLSAAPERRPFLKWMATGGEVRAKLAGDAYLDTEEGSTHSISIAAEPRQVWPWLVQMGYGRGGWYSHDWLDNLGRRSATKILPEFQEIKPGDFLPTSPNGKFGFEVLEVNPDRHLVLASHFAIGPMRSIPWSEQSPPTFLRATWAFVLERTEGGGTRLIVRGRSTSAPAWRWFLWNGFFSAAHVIMQRKQLLNLKRRASLAAGDIVLRVN